MNASVNASARPARTPVDVSKLRVLRVWRKAEQNSANKTTRLEPITNNSDPANSGLSLALEELPTQAFQHAHWTDSHLAGESRAHDAMNGTPRLRSAYPATPQNTGRRDGASGSASQLRSPLPDVNALKQQQQNSDGDSGPLIPFETIDAPQQRLYVVAFYVALLAWRLYDFHYLQEEETESLWLFMKWVAFDGIFLFGLPELRIPWLEWSSMTMTVLFIAHAILDGILMFRIPIPLGAGLVAISKIFYDRELAISERHVKHSDVVHNASLILGRTVVHILPEGYMTFQFL